MNNTRTAIIEAYREARARFHAARPDGDTAGYLYDDLVEHADALLNDLDPRREIFSAAELVRIYLRGHRAEPVIWYGRPAANPNKRC